MKIYGLQKLTLLDFPGKTACTVFTAGCNFRCPYCHNASLVNCSENAEYINEGNFFAFLAKRKGLLDGVAITGGEPTLVSDLYIFIKQIKLLGFQVKLDTNGTNPAVIQKLAEDSLLDYVALDIKNSREKYPLTVGKDIVDISKIEDTVNILRNGNIPHEFRTTVVKELHELSDFTAIGEWLKGDENYYLQQFKDSGDILSKGMSAPEISRMTEFSDELKKYFRNTHLRG